MRVGAVVAHHLANLFIPTIHFSQKRMRAGAFAAHHLANFSKKYLIPY